MSHRNERVGDVLLSFLGEEVRRFADPRLALVTLTGISVSKDLRNVRIFWTSAVAVDPAGKEADGGEVQFPSKERVGLIDKALSGATGFLRKRIAEELSLRYVPQLVFEYDKSAESGARIEYLLSKANLTCN